MTTRLAVRNPRRIANWILACVLTACGGDPDAGRSAGDGKVPPVVSGGSAGATVSTGGAAGTSGVGASTVGAAGASMAGGAATGGAGSGGGAPTDAGRAVTDGARTDGDATDGGRAEAGASERGRADAAASDAGGTVPPRVDGSAPKLTIYLAGDSTVSQYTLDPADPKSWAGWGQMLQPHYDVRAVTVLDKAVGGMTARHFILGGNLSSILNVLKAGDYLFVQFGTNDSNTSAMFTIDGVSYPYFADASSDFKTYLQQYIDGARAKSAIPVLVTPPPRNSAYCGGPRSLANYGQAMIEVGAAQKVAVVDLGLKTWTYLNTICPKPVSGTTETFFKVTGTVIDGTHFQENGARVMAGFVADGVGEASLGVDVFRLK